MHRYRDSLFQRIAVNATANGRESDCFNGMLFRKCETDAIARCEQFRLTRVASVPHRPDRVYDILCRQLITARDFCLPGFAAVECAACSQQFRPGRAMYGTVDTTAAEQRRVSGVNDRIDVQRHDVGLQGFQCGGHEIFVSGVAAPVLRGPEQPIRAKNVPEIIVRPAECDLN